MSATAGIRTNASRVTRVIRTNIAVVHICLQIYLHSEPITCT